MVAPVSGHVSLRASSYELFVAGVAAARRHRARHSAGGESTWLRRT